MKTKMKLEFDQITTRGGDHGETSLYNGERRRKDDLIFDTLGDLDELNSALGVVKAGISQFPPVSADSEKLKAWLASLNTIQSQLILLSGMVANPDNSRKIRDGGIVEKDIENLEKEQKRLMDVVFSPREFILPGDSLVSAWIDMARTICRRCERDVVRCIRREVMQHLIPCQIYLNRLSDYLFVSGRYWDQVSG